MNNFNKLVNLIIEQHTVSEGILSQTGKIAGKAAKLPFKAVSKVARGVASVPGKVVRGTGKIATGAGKAANILKDPHNSAGAERLSGTLNWIGSKLNPDPSQKWNDADSSAGSNNSTGVQSRSPQQFKERDYFYIIQNNKPFAGKITKITRDYVFVKLFKHPRYGSVIIYTKSRTPEAYFYKETIPKGKSRYLDREKASISYNQKKRHWVAVTK